MKRAVLLCVILSAAFSVSAQSGIIRELSGTVELKAPGSRTYTAARPGDRVSPDTVISTGFRSAAIIEAGSAVIAVRSLTRLTLTELRSSQGVETLNVNLQAGRLRVDVNPPAGTRARMTISSPSATASVRGTSFEFDTQNLRVSQGSVNFQGSRGNSMLVSAGSASRVEGDGSAANPIDTKLAEFAPKTPAGTDSGGSSGGASARVNAAVSFEVTYLAGTGQ